MEYLIDLQMQTRIAHAIDAAVERTLAGLVNHGNEEALTSALGAALMTQSFSGDGLKVKFSYRQLHKQTEEPDAGGDGAFLVSVVTPNTTVRKAALFQAKLLRGDGPVRELSMTKSQATKLHSQSRSMLRHTKEAVALIYTSSEIYVVDARKYVEESVENSRLPLFAHKRLITLGTYLGKWLPRCTRGDRAKNFVARAEHIDGFRRGIEMTVVSTRPGIHWPDDQVDGF